MLGEKIAMLLSLNVDQETGKKLFGSLLGKGSVPVICSIVGLAIVVAIVIYLQKKKKSNKGDDENE